MKRIKPKNNPREKPKQTLVFDRITINDAAESKRVYDSNGFLHVYDNPFTREQVVQYKGNEIPDSEYHGFDPEKLYYVYRPASELSKPETINGLNGIPLTLEHKECWPDSIPKNQIGAAGTDAEWDAPFLKNSLHFFKREAIDLIESGEMTELSLGYLYTPKFEEGIAPNGQKYDVVMTDIRPNHIALVEEGRAGPEVAVQDSKPTYLKKGYLTMDETQSSEIIDKLSVFEETIKDLKRLLQNSGANDSDDMPEDEDDKITDPNVPENDAEDEDPAEDKDPAEDEGDDDPALDDDDEGDDDPALDDDDEGDDDPALDDDDEGDDDPALDDDDDDQALDEEDDPALDEDSLALTDDMVKEILIDGGFSEEELTPDVIKGVKAGFAAVSGKGKQTPTGDSKRGFRGKLNKRFARISKSAVNMIALNKFKQMRQRDRARMKATALAAREVSGVLGNIDPMAFDCAAQIYRRALRKYGLSPKEVGKMKGAAARASFRAIKKHMPLKRKLTGDSVVKRAPANATERSLDLVLSRFKNNGGF